MHDYCIGEQIGGECIRSTGTYKYYYFTHILFIMYTQCDTLDLYFKMSYKNQDRKLF